jgi:hypothetical protein
MTGQQSLIARSAVSVLMGGVSVISCLLSFPQNLPCRTFDTLVNAAFVVSRLAIYALIFVVLKIAPRGDIPAFYWDESVKVLHHLLPYRDFLSSYAPLHPYLDALVIQVWYSPLAIILFAICVEAFILPLWLRIGRTFLTEREVRSGALLYLTSAISIQFVAIDGQDNVLIAVLLVLALLLVYRCRIFASGAAVGLSVAAVKFLPLLYFPAFLATIPRSLRWAAGALTVILVVYGSSLALHLPIITPLLFEGAMRSAGNLPFLIEGVLGVVVSSTVWNSLAFAVCVLIVLLIASKSRNGELQLRLRILTFGFAALTLALLLFSKKSWPPYLMLSLFPTCLLVTRGNKRNILGFAIFQVLAIVAMSFWATVLSQIDSTQFHQGLLQHQVDCFILLALQLGLIVGYIWLLKLSLSEVHYCRLPAELNSVAS